MNRFFLQKVLNIIKVKASKELLFVFLGQLIAALGTLVGVRLLTQQLSPISYGEISLGLTIGVLFQQILFGPLSNSYLRYFSIAQERNELPGFLISVKQTAIKSICFSLLIFLLIVIIFLIIGWASYLWLILFSFLFMLFSSLNSFLDNLQNAARQRIIVAWHQGIGSWLKYLLAVLAIILLGSNSKNAAGGFALSAIFVFCSQIFFFFQSTVFNNKKPLESPLQNTKNWEKDLWAYASPFMTWGLFTWAQISSDRWALSMFASTTDVGLFTVLYQLGYYPISLLSTILLQFISPILFQITGDASEEGRSQKAKRYIRNLVFLSLIFGLIATIITLIFHNLIFKVLVGPEYRQISYLLPWIVLSACIFTSGQFAAMHYLNAISPNKLVGIKVLSAIFGIAINFLFTRFFGVIGTVIASLIFSIAYLVLILLLPKVEFGGKCE